MGPNSLSFSTPQSYRDIYGHVTHGKKRFLKAKWYEADEPRIVRVRDPVVHTEQRRTLSHAFSARALRDQEDVFHKYVDLLLKQLDTLGAGGTVAVNATEIWNWLTFDAIGQFSPGVFNGLVARPESLSMVRRGFGIWRALWLPFWRV